MTLYMHVNKINSKKYIGITARPVSVRWRHDGSGYMSSPHFYNAIQKYGWDNFEHIILRDDLEEEQAICLECELIEKHNTCDPLFGYNTRTGGELNKPSVISLEKIRGEKHPMYGKSHTPETVEKIRRTIGDSRKKEKNVFYGKTHTDEAKRKNAEKHSIKVYQYSLDGIFIREWESAIAALRSFGRETGGITSCCKGKLRTAFGYRWSYKSDADFDLKIHKNSRQILQLDESNNVLASFNNYKEAVAATGITSIISVCKGRYKTAGGYKWVYADDYIK